MSTVVGQAALATLAFNIAASHASGFQCPAVLDPSLEAQYEAEGWTITPSRSGVSERLEKRSAYLNSFSLYQRGYHVLPRFVEEDADLIGTWDIRGDDWTAGCGYHVSRSDFVTMYRPLAGETICKSSGHAGDTSPSLAMHAYCR